MTTAVPRLGAEALDDLERFGRRPLAGLVLGPERRARHVLVEGEQVVRDGRLLGADMDELRRDLARRTRRLWPEDAR